MYSPFRLSSSFVSITQKNDKVQITLWFVPMAAAAAAEEPRGGFGSAAVSFDRAHCASY
jgi:hypothetical protein